MKKKSKKRNKLPPLTLNSQLNQILKLKSLFLQSRNKFNPLPKPRLINNLLLTKRVVKLKIQLSSQTKEEAKKIAAEYDQKMKKASKQGEGVNLRN